MSELFQSFICNNIGIALSESVLKIRGTAVGFSRRALLNLREKKIENQWD